MSVRYVNALVSSKQLVELAQDQDDQDIDATHHVTAANSVQVAGMLLYVDQVVISTAMVLLQRHFISYGHVEDAHACVVLAGGALLLACKLSEGVITPSNIALVVNCLRKKPSLVLGLSSLETRDPEQRVDVFPEEIIAAERQILLAIGFDTKVTLPYNLALSYLQVLGILQRESGTKIAQFTWAIINDGIRTSSQLMVVHQPSVVAVASIIVAATRANAVVSDHPEWWTLFDVDVEDMGHAILLITGGIKHETEMAAA